MLNRRSFLTGSAALAGSAAVLRPFTGRALAETAAAGSSTTDTKAWPPAQPDADYQPVTVLDSAKLPWQAVDGAKVFHLVAESAGRHAGQARRPYRSPPRGH